MTTSLAAPLPARSRTTRWNHAGRSLEIAVTEQGGPGPAWLLLPALSTISSRQEWEPFAAAISRRQGAEAPRLISVDWPGFGDSDRPRLPYDAELLARFLADFVRDHCPADCGVIAAGHAAGIALLDAERHGLRFRDWVLVAPTWRGPFPTMARRQSRAFPVIRGLVETPLLGPLLYRLNTTRSVLGWMSRRHVDVAGPGLSAKGIAERQGIARQRGARFASAAFVTGGLDPYNDPEGWIQAARTLHSPLTVVVADQSPPKSLAEMQALAAVADRVLHLPGRLGAHEEFGAELAAMLSQD
ncbi:alpha/beta hydrolase [Cyanobium sp. Cruz CV13-4-11]|uniref:alpha/beta fold hydrolase n=1 Tax=unclassified Cyanobium TaxID=2627006 RepID=UPI0020CFA3C9|nr:MULTISPECIES: alpha/beta hydrolase [unclassified Cyanobium]MCP9901852.1 alpha/beta hydrolase [Cyanobium sp. Cruz CV11-17]MCP9920793.1 alpha/beta hydrolase [Cyanobium sp. Cruz CV13-4-11]